MQKHTSLGALLAIASGCAPTFHKLPAAALSYAATQQGDQWVHVELRPVTAATFVPGHDPATRMRWRERRVYAALPGPVPEDRQLYIALVPRPSLEVTIENDSDRPLTFADAEIQLTDDSGARYEVARDVHDYLPDLLGPAMAASPSLWLARLRWGPVDLWPRRLTTSVGPGLTGELALAAAIRAAAAQVPLFGRDVVVPPHGRWSGALVFDTDAGMGDTLAERLRGNLQLRWRGARLGDDEQPPLIATMPLAVPPEAEACMQLPFGEPSGRRAGVPKPPVVIDGMAVTSTEADNEMIGLRASRGEALAARKLRIAGGVLMGAGVLGAAMAPAAIAISGDSKEAAAGVSMLALTGVGAALTFIGGKHEKAARARYNRYMAESGACAAPR